MCDPVQCFLTSSLTKYHSQQASSYFSFHTAPCGGDACFPCYTVFNTRNTQKPFPGERKTVFTFEAEHRN
jgi:hypothetical protein